MDVSYEFFEGAVLNAHLYGTIEPEEIATLMSDRDFHSVRLITFWMSSFLEADIVKKCTLMLIIDHVLTLDQFKSWKFINDFDGKMDKVFLHFDAQQNERSQDQCGIDLLNKWVRQGVYTKDRVHSLISMINLAKFERCHGKLIDAYVEMARLRYEATTITDDYVRINQLIDREIELSKEVADLHLRVEAFQMAGLKISHGLTDYEQKSSSEIEVMIEDALDIVLNDTTYVTEKSSNVSDFTQPLNVSSDFAGDYKSTSQLQQLLCNGVSGEYQNSYRSISSPGGFEQFSEMHHDNAFAVSYNFQFEPETKMQQPPVTMHHGNVLQLPILPHPRRQRNLVKSMVHHEQALTMQCH